MGSILSRVCPCLGIRESKVEQDVKLSTIDFIKQQNELDRLSNDELGTSIAYYVMSKRRYYNI